MCYKNIFVLNLLIIFSLLSCNVRSAALIPLLMEDFESDFVDWVNVTAGDNNDWTRNSGGTPTNQTGPSNGAETSQYYVFLETSTGAARNAGDNAILLGPVLTHDNIHLHFQYHLYGKNTGTLSVDVLVEGVWLNDVWSISGAQQSNSDDSYSQISLDLSSYKLSRLRFRATAAGGYRGDMAIDKIEISTSLVENSTPVFYSDPLIKSEAFQGESYGDSIVSDASDLDGDRLFFSKVSGPDWLNVDSNGDLTGKPGNNDSGDNAFVIKVSDGELSSMTTLHIVVNASDADTVLMFSDFEINFGDWSNVSTGDSHNWTRRSGNTPSASTGPVGGADGSQFYLYLETSSKQANSNGDTAILLSPPMTGSNLQLNFQYHLYGVDIGTLAVDIREGDIWFNDIWFASGQQQNASNDSYTAINVDLGGYAVSQIRFRARAVGGYRGDMAIDNIEVVSRQVEPVAPVFINDPVSKPNAASTQPYLSTLQDEAMDANNDSIVYSKVSGPAWLTIAPSGLLSGTPAVSDLGVNDFVVSASDGDLMTSASLTIYVEDFDALVLLSETDFEVGLDDWHHVTSSESKTWSRSSNSTATADTGPNKGANNSQYYLYFETSSSFSNSPGDTAIIESPEINQTNIHLKFQYHMYGSDTGTLSVDVFSNGEWLENVWSKTGAQHLSTHALYWTVLLDLSDYDVSKIRFRATAAGGYLGDIAIDNLQIFSGRPEPLGLNNTPCSERYLTEAWKLDRAAHEALIARNNSGKGVWQSNLDVGGEGIKLLVAAGDENPINWQADVFKDRPVDSACFVYYMYYKDDYFDSKWSKLPGLFGSNAQGYVRAEGGMSADEQKKPENNGSWSNRSQYDGFTLNPYNYAYHLGRTDLYGDALNVMPYVQPKGQWFKMEVEVVMNDIGKDNGVSRIWLDGQSNPDQHTNIIWREDAEVGVVGPWVDIYYGGSPTQPPSHDVTVYFKNMLLLTP